VRSSVPHPRAPEGAVLAQAPLPGQRVRPGAPVGVTLSRGPETHVLPDVSGLSSRQARIVLERLGFRVTEERSTHAVEAGRAFGTEPEAGRELPVPAEVVLRVSDGPGLTPVPQLEGRPIDEALRLLEEGELALGAISYDPRADAEPGTIVGQYPPGGYTLRRGDAVEIRVAGDPDRVNRRRSRPAPAGPGEV
ncbi:MAG: PASTA domain-containing protein, partial [Gemmatimonadota bacterium]|nr:PASTA domain-containing protein [Gemmatimonadota bacterium]